MRANPLSRNLQVTLLAAAAAFGQDFGTHDLPAEFAEPGAKVLGVMNKAPNGSRNLGYSEGPAVDAEGNLYFTEDNAGSGNIWKVTPAGAGSNFHTGAGLPNGLEFDPQGKLIACEKGAVSAFDKAGTRTPLAMNPALDAAKRINDLSISSTGAMFFTNWDGNNVYYRSADGTVKKYSGYSTTNGIEWIEEKKILLLAQDGPDAVFKYEVNPDGTLKNEKKFADINEPDGLTLDANGNVYIASWMDGKIHVFDSAGVKKGSVTVKGDNNQNGNTSNCVFGGPDNKTLYITGDGGAFKIQMKIAGRKRPGSTAVRKSQFRSGSRPKSRLDGFSIDGRNWIYRNPEQIPTTRLMNR